MPGAVDPHLVNILGAFAQALTDEVTAAAEAASDLREAGPAALVALHESSTGRSIDDLRGLVGLTHSGTVRLVDRLESAGYVQRGDGRNARTVGLTLTRTGVALAVRIRQARYRVIDAALEKLGERDRVELERLIAVLVAAATERRLMVRDSGGRPPGGALCRLCDFQACGRPDGRCPTLAATTAHQAIGAMDAVAVVAGPPGESGSNPLVEQLELLVFPLLEQGASAHSASGGAEGVHGPAAGLAAAVVLRRLADRLEDSEVERAVRSGWQWSEVAGALGVTRQAVHKKHARRLTERPRS